jgi:hypothetical protein
VAREEALTSPVGAETRNVALEAWLRWVAHRVRREFWTFTIENGTLPPVITTWHLSNSISPVAAPAKTCFQSSTEGGDGERNDDDSRSRASTLTRWTKGRKTEWRRKEETNNDLKKWKNKTK